MNLKITGRFILTVALVTIIVIIINISIGIIYGFNKGNNIDGTDEIAYFSLEDFTDEFSKYLLNDGEQIYIHKDGEEILQKHNAWIQVLDEDGNEVYSYEKPIKVKESYNPMELIHAYKYSLAETESTIFISEKDFPNKNHSYIIGFPYEKVGRIVFSYEDDKLYNTIKGGISMVLFVSIIIALLFGYLFSRRLTKPLEGIIGDVQNLSQGQYNLQREEKGIYKQIYKNINNLSKRLRSNEEERKNLDNMREEWIANISHDIKTPLVSIKGYAETLSNEEYEFTRGEIKEYSEIIENKSDYIKELIDDLNLSTRLKNKALTLNLENINIVSLVREIIIDILNNPQNSKENIEFSTRKQVIEKDLDKIIIKKEITNIKYNHIINIKRNYKKY